jgi:hypothetical protein
MALPAPLLPFPDIAPFPRLILDNTLSRPGRPGSFSYSEESLAVVTKSLGSLASVAKGDLRTRLLTLPAPFRDLPSIAGATHAPGSRRGARQAGSPGNHSIRVCASRDAMVAQALRKRVSLVLRCTKELATRATRWFRLQRIPTFAPLQSTCPPPRPTQLPRPPTTPPAPPSPSAAELSVLPLLVKSLGTTGYKFFCSSAPLPPDHSDSCTSRHYARLTDYCDRVRTDRFGTGHRVPGKVKAALARLARRQTSLRATRAGGPKRLGQVPARSADRPKLVPPPHTNPDFSVTTLTRRTGTPVVGQLVGRGGPAGPKGRLVAHLTESTEAQYDPRLVGSGFEPTGYIRLAKFLDSCPATMAIVCSPEGDQCARDPVIRGAIHSWATSLPRWPSQIVSRDILDVSLPLSTCYCDSPGDHFSFPVDLAVSFLPHLPRLSVPTAALEGALMSIQHSKRLELIPPELRTMSYDISVVRVFSGSLHPSSPIRRCLESLCLPS